jgi:hypothetical protein
MNNIQYNRPVAILLGTSYRLAAQFNSDYWPFFWWLCLWTSILHLITAMVGYVPMHIALLFVSTDDDLSLSLTHPLAY